MFRYLTFLTLTGAIKFVLYICIYMVHFPEGAGYFFTTFRPTFYQSNSMVLFLQGQNFCKVAYA
jgi:hypothetical protein